MEYSSRISLSNPDGRVPPIRAPAFPISKDLITDHTNLFYSFTVFKILSFKKNTIAIKFHIVNCKSSVLLY